MTTAKYSNRKTGNMVEVIMDGQCLGWHKDGGTMVRKTTDGRFAVVSVKGNRLIRIFTDEMHARRYNFSIHGDQLGV